MEKADFQVEEGEQKRGGEKAHTGKNEQSVMDARGEMEVVTRPGGQQSPST